MNVTKWTLLLGVVLMAGGTGALLARMQGHRKLGEPGLRMARQDVLDETGKVINTNTVLLPDDVPGYKSSRPPISTYEINWLPKDTTYARRLYEADDGFRMVLSVILMGTDRGSIHKPQICLTGQGWKIERSDLEYVPIDRPHKFQLPVMKLTASKLVRFGDGREVKLYCYYVYWFVADQHLTAEHGERMWWMAKELLRSGTLQRWAYVSCLSHFLPGQETATYERIRRFISTVAPDFQLATKPPALAAKD